MGTLVESTGLARQLDCCSRPTFNFVAKFKPGDFDFVNVKTPTVKSPFHKKPAEETEDDEKLSTKPLKTKCTLVDAVVRKDANLLRELLAKTDEVKEENVPRKMEVDGADSSPAPWEHHAKRIEEVLQSHKKMQMNSAMVLAISSRAPEMLDILITHGADPESFSHSFPITHSAVYTKSMELIDVLLKHGATFGGTSIAGTALHCAAVAGSVDVLHRLVKHGLDINARNSDGLTPLHLAINYSHTQCAQFLIDNNCAINLAEWKNGCTPLHLAAAKGNYAIANCLLEKGADRDFKDNEGWTSWMTAAVNNRGMLMTLLLEKNQDLNQVVNKEGKTLLHFACQKGNELCVRLLLLNGADPNSTDCNGHTPLMEAVINKKLFLVKILLTVATCDVNSLNADGETALSLAFAAYTLKPQREFLKKMVKTLLAAGADINQRFSDGSTLLMKFANTPFKLKVMLELKADPNTVTDTNCTALWEATKASVNSRSVESLTTLFENSQADPRLTSLLVEPEKINPVQYCLEQGYHVAAETLLNYDCSVSNMSKWLASDRAKELKQGDAELKRVMDMVEHRCRTPSSLLDISRLCVLSSGKPSCTLAQKLNQLEIPKILTSYIQWPHYRVCNDISPISC